MEWYGCGSGIRGRNGGRIKWRKCWNSGGISIIWRSRVSISHERR
jgi:hypothetical protein